jgi:hypothetical protein
MNQRASSAYGALSGSERARHDPQHTVGAEAGGALAQRRTATAPQVQRTGPGRQEHEVVLGAMALEEAHAGAGDHRPSIGPYPRPPTVPRRGRVPCPYDGRRATPCRRRSGSGRSSRCSRWLPAPRATPLLLATRSGSTCRHRWLTALFGSYAAGLVPALFLAGPLSDRLGRRRVAIPGIALSAVASLAFALAGGSLAAAVRRALRAGRGERGVFSVGSALGWLSCPPRPGRGAGGRRAAVAMDGRLLARAADQRAARAVRPGAHGAVPTSSTPPRSRSAWRSPRACRRRSPAGRTPRGRRGARAAGPARRRLARRHRARPGGGLRLRLPGHHDLRRAAAGRAARRPASR